MSVEGELGVRSQTQQINYTEIGINNELPENVKCIREDFIGTASGNPSSEVIWTFRQDAIDQAPQFIVAEQTIDTSFRPEKIRDKVIRALGPYKESEYRTLMNLINERSDFFGTEYDHVVSSNGARNRLGIEMSVPWQRTTERIMGIAVKIILND